MLDALPPMFSRWPNAGAAADNDPSECGLQLLLKLLRLAGHAWNPCLLRPLGPNAEPPQPLTLMLDCLLHCCCCCCCCCCCK
jgi:hypothetical protein